MGYLLTPDTTQQKMMWLVGRKRSGKGTKPTRSRQTHVEEWLHDHYQAGEGGVFMDDLYVEYKQAMEGRETILNRSVVGKKLRALFPDVKRTKRTHLTYYQVIVLKSV